MVKRFVCLLICLMPSLACAQVDAVSATQVADALQGAIQDVAPGADVKITTDGGAVRSTDGTPAMASSADAVPTRSAEAGEPEPFRPRRKREIKNREFDDRQKIQLLLSAHCGFPSKDDLLSTSPEAEKHVQDIINDESVLQSVRERALRALAYFITDGNEESLREILENSYDAPNRMTIIYAIVAYASVAGRRSASLIEKFLSHKDDYVRLIAIRNLKQTPGAEPLAALKRRRDVETNRFFQAKLDQAIADHCKQKTRCEQ